MKTTFDENEESKNGYDVDAAEFRLNEYYIKIYCIWMNFIFMGLIPFVALILLNAQTVKSLVMQVRKFDTIAKLPWVSQWFQNLKKNVQFWELKSKAKINERFPYSWQKVLENIMSG